MSLPISSRSLRILVVDDCPSIRWVLQFQLRAWGHAVSEAADGPAALRAAPEFRPEVVLLDINLPRGMDGYEVARRLRRFPGLEGVLLVALTGCDSEEDVRCAREAGFDHHLAKPVHAEVLERLLEDGVEVPF